MRHNLRVLRVQNRQHVCQLTISLIPQLGRNPNGAAFGGEFAPFLEIHLMHPIIAQAKTNMFSRDLSASFLEDRRVCLAPDGTGHCRSIDSLEQCPFGSEFLVFNFQATPMGVGATTNYIIDIMAT